MVTVAYRAIPAPFFAPPPALLSALPRRSTPTRPDGLAHAARSHAARWGIAEQAEHEWGVEGGEGDVWVGSASGARIGLFLTPPRKVEAEPLERHFFDACLAHRFSLLPFSATPRSSSPASPRCAAVEGSRLSLDLTVDLDDFFGPLTHEAREGSLADSASFLLLSLLPGSAPFLPRISTPPTSASLLLPRTSTSATASRSEDSEEKKRREGGPHG
ncbi:hypothetical protein MSAN_01681500 [Mycena sanguinolenta]|uniref:Uncharacterized protein n=1 Tax=Mycena sanguinolenta TaxID=230812 RepID=A0A8H6Y068_9AGAR|nr:hypothetical protein MSAN_01681500 [Mycena sanguinolenta]